MPDNAKSAVTHPSYYEPDLNPTYRDLGRALWRGDYSGAALSSQGQRLEGGGGGSRWSSAGLCRSLAVSASSSRWRKSTKLIAELLVRLNQRPFRHKRCEGSRATLFLRN